jgi:hypothetical protein
MPYFLEYPAHFSFGKKHRPKIGTHGLFMHKHHWHCCLSLLDDMPTVFVYPSEGKCVNFRYELSVTKRSQCDVFAIVQGQCEAMHIKNT